MAPSARVPITLLVTLLVASAVPAQCRRTYSSGDSLDVEWPGRLPSPGEAFLMGDENIVDAASVLIPIANSKLALNGKVFKCCVHSQNETAILQDMSEDLPKERSVCMDREGCGCMFGDHFHSYDHPASVCDVKLRDLSRMTGISLQDLWSRALSSIVGVKRPTDVLPPALDACHATRPQGVQTQGMYCTKDQGFACEVFTAGFGFKVHVTVWNSYGCGCDAKAFRQGSWNTRKRPNGPRIWTADTFVSGDEPTPGSLDETGRYVTEVFDGITYKYGAELKIPYSTMVENARTGNQPFIRSTISRFGKRIWRKGRQVYELKVGGDTFIMQAVSQQVDPMLTDNSGLKDLLSRRLPDEDTFGNKVEGGGSAMQLPEGMTYRCRVLAEDLILESNGTAVIMQDHFYNNYMLENVEAKYEVSECVEETEKWRLDYCKLRMREWDMASGWE